MMRPISVGGGEEQGRAGHVVGKAHAAIGYRFTDEALLFAQRAMLVLGEQGIDLIPHRGVDDAGGDAVDVDAVLDEVEAGRLGEADHRRLAGAVDADQRLAAPARLARKVDDLAAPALPDHLPRHRLQGKEQALDVDREHPVVALLGDVENRGEVEHGGVVDENVDAAGPIYHHLNQSADRVAAGDVELHRKTAVAEFIGESRTVLHGAIGHDDAGSFGGIAPADRRADAARCASDDRDLTFELHGGPPMTLLPGAAAGAGATASRCNRAGFAELLASSCGVSAPCYSRLPRYRVRVSAVP